MRAHITRVLALAVASSLSVSLFAQDECTSPTTLALGANGPFDNTGATLSAPAWACGSGVTADIWFTFTTPAGIAGLATIDTEGSTGLTDTVLEIFDGCGGNLIACDDDSGTGFLSSISFNAAGGTTYYARVGGWGGGSGQFNVNYAFSSPDECTGAVVINDGVNGPFSNVGATTSSPAASCSTINSDLWFAHTASCTGTLTVETGSAGAGSITDTVMECWDACGGTLLACDDDGGAGFYSLISLPVTQGTTYYFRVGDFGTTVNQGLFNVSVTNTPNPGSFNDACACALPLAAGANGPFDTTGSTVSAPAWPCGFVNSGDIWFTYTAVGCSNVSFDTFGSGMDTVLQVFDASGGCGNLVSLGCNDDTGGLQSQVNLSGVVAGQQFAVRVAGYSSNFGTFPLNVTETPVALANDDCAGALPIVLGMNGGYDTSCATTSVEPWPCASGGNDVWFTFAANCTAPHTFRTCGSGFDTCVEVLDGTCGALTSLGCNDDASSGPCQFTLQSSLTVNLTNGVTYYVRVGGFNGAQGSFQLEALAGNGNGSIAVTTPSQCTVAGLDLTITGSPAIGSTLATTMTGYTGLPFVILTLATPSPILAPACPCMSFGGGGWLFGDTITLSVPCFAGYIGLPVQAQGVDLLGAPAACNAFGVATAFTDIYTISIQ